MSGKNEGPRMAQMLQEAAAEGCRVFVAEVKVTVYWSLPEDRPESIIPEKVVQHLVERGFSGDGTTVLSVAQLPQHFN